MSNVIIDHITLEGPTPKLAWVQYVQWSKRRSLVIVKKMNRRGSEGMCGRKPAISSQKEGGDKGMSERKECADRMEDKFHLPCCSHNICASGAVQIECIVWSLWSYISVVIRL